MSSRVTMSQLEESQEQQSKEDPEEEMTVDGQMASGENSHVEYDFLILEELGEDDDDAKRRMQRLREECHREYLEFREQMAEMERKEREKAEEEDRKKEEWKAGSRLLSRVGGFDVDVARANQKTPNLGVRGGGGCEDLGGGAATRPRGVRRPQGRRGLAGWQRRGRRRQQRGWRGRRRRQQQRGRRARNPRRRPQSQPRCWSPRLGGRRRSRAPPAQKGRRRRWRQQHRGRPARAARNEARATAAVRRRTDEEARRAR